MQKQAPNPEAYTDEPDLSHSHMIIEDLELDDKHAEFLDPINRREEDEVERLVGKVAEQFEVLDIPSADQSSLL